MGSKKQQPFSAVSVRTNELQASAFCTGSVRSSYIVQPIARICCYRLLSMKYVIAANADLYVSLIRVFLPFFYGRRIIDARWLVNDRESVIVQNIFIDNPVKV